MRKGKGEHEGLGGGSEGSSGRKGIIERRKGNTQRERGRGIEKGWRRDGV